MFWGARAVCHSFALFQGGAENAGVENAGVEKSGVDRRGGKCRSDDVPYRVGKRAGYTYMFNYNTHNN